MKCVLLDAFFGWCIDCTSVCPIFDIPSIVVSKSEIPKVKISESDLYFQFFGRVRNIPESCDYKLQSGISRNAASSQVRSLIAKSDYQKRHICPSVYPSLSPSACPSVLMELDSHQTDFREILYREVLLKFVDACQFSLKPDNNSTLQESWPTFMTK